MKNNQKIRQEIEHRRLRYFEVANILGISACTLSVWLRFELSPEREAQIMDAIKIAAAKISENNQVIS